ncbi:hypothetical protein [Ralstonia solanacearum]|uniref:hypothetical protein n=1 Tax=Ralstonia solanacearum TaxID=305 RepID=UPI001F2A93C8|nr:hypothetical protein [Ralstonia solanacearum]
MLAPAQRVQQVAGWPVTTLTMIQRGTRPLRLLCSAGSRASAGQRSDMTGIN